MDKLEEQIRQMDDGDLDAFRTDLEGALTDGEVPDCGGYYPTPARRWIRALVAIVEAEDCRRNGPIEQITNTELATLAGIVQGHKVNGMYGKRTSAEIGEFTESLMATVLAERDRRAAALDGDWAEFVRDEEYYRVAERMGNGIVWGLPTEEEAEKAEYNAMREAVALPPPDGEGQ